MKSAVEWYKDVLGLRHKFERHIEGNLIFRARKTQTHIVYAIDKAMRIIFLRAIKNFKEYKKFLENRKGILRMIAQTHVVDRLHV